MALVNKKANKNSCGGRTRVTYVYKKGKLIYSEINHEHHAVLQGFPEEGHFLIQATKAIVKTSEKVGAYEAPDYCSLKVTKKPGAPKLNTTSMHIINSDCEMPIAKKREQIIAGETRPVIAEKVNIEDPHASPFQSERIVECEYQPHYPRLLDKHPIEAIKEYEAECNTANLVEFFPPRVLCYGSKYLYTMLMKTVHAYLLTHEPLMIITFYGRIYETICGYQLKYTPTYLAKLMPSIREKKQAETGPKIYLPQHKSNIDDYNDPGSDGMEDGEYERRSTQQAAAYALKLLMKGHEPAFDKYLQAVLEDDENDRRRNRKEFDRLMMSREFSYDEYSMSLC